MDNLKTLREICNILEVTRRAVQGYEKAGLVTPSERNKYGYLFSEAERIPLPHRFSGRPSRFFDKRKGFRFPTLWSGLHDWRIF